MRMRSSFSLIELMFPLLIVTMILGYSGSRYLAGIGNSILIFMIMFVVVDMFANYCTGREDLKTAMATAERSTKRIFR